MGHSSLFFCVLAVFASVPLSYADIGNEAQHPKCNELLTRKEWRALTNTEKAEWVGAVKVCSLYFPHVACTLLTPLSA